MWIINKPRHSTWHFSTTENAHIFPLFPPLSNGGLVLIRQLPKIGYVICQAHWQPLRMGNSAGGLPPRVGRAGEGVGVQKRRGALRAFLCGTNLQASETSLELAGSTLPLSQHFHLDVSNSGCGYLRLQCNDSKAEREEKGEEFLHLSPVFLRSGE